MDVLEVISSRRSHRSYKEDQLTEESLSAILKAGLESPSARNQQPWNFTVVYAPTVIFIFGENDFPWTQVDCGIAVENMALAAEGLGIGSVILGLPKPAFNGDKADELRAKLQCPEGYDFVVALALGYATDTKNAHDLREEKIRRITG